MAAGSSFDYNAAYLDGKLAGWTAISIGAISGRLLNTLKNQPFPRQGVVLDFGCGSGAYQPYLAQSALDVVGADISPEAVRQARQLPYKAVLLIDPGKPPLPERSTAILFSTEVLEHIEDAEAAIIEFSQMLQAGGLLILTTTLYFSSINVYLSAAIQHKHSVPTVIKEILRFLAGCFSARYQNEFVRKWCFEPLGGHFHGFKTGALKAMVQQAGFEVMETHPLYILPPVGFSRHSTIEGVRNSFRFPLNLIMIAMVLAVAASNFCLKKFGMGANNIYLVARKARAVA